MEKHNYEEELKKERRIVGNLVYEIDYKNQQLSEMEHKYNETTATLHGLIDGLIAKINSKDSSLWDWELRYNTTVRELRDENTELHDKFVEGTSELYAYIYIVSKILCIDSFGTTNGVLF